MWRHVYKDIYIAALSVAPKVWRRLNISKGLVKLWNIHAIQYNAAVKKWCRGFPGGAVVESPPANAGDTGLCPGPGRSYMPRSGWAP